MEVAPCSATGCTAVVGIKSKLVEKQAAAQQHTLPTVITHIQAAIDEAKVSAGEVNKDQDPASASLLRKRILDLLETYCKSNSQDWKQFAFFNDARTHYVRNLVHGNEDFELLVLCWGPGQTSRVHNHGHSHCFLAVLEGPMREVQYQPLAMPAEAGGAGLYGIPAGASVELKATKDSEMNTGDAGYINDNLCLHTVGCDAAPRCRAYGPDSASPRDTGSSQQQQQEAFRGGVTLHLYAPPIRRVKIFEDGSVSERVPGYYTVNGQRV